MAAIAVEIYEGKHAPAVATFNRQLRQAGQRRLLPDVPFHRPEGSETVGVYPLCLLAVSESDQILAGVDILVRPYRVGNSEEAVASWRVIAPESLSVETAQGLIESVVRRFPLSLLRTGLPESAMLAQITERAGFLRVPLAHYFQVCHPQAYLRNLTALRERAAWRLLTDIAAVTGAGAAGILSLQASRRKKRGRLGRLEAQPIPAFDNTSNDLWRDVAGEYSLTAQRTRVILNRLYAQETARYHRVEVRVDGEPVGWGVLSERRMKDHEQYGNMEIGVIEDGFSAPGHAEPVVNALAGYLSGRSVDLMIAHVTHPWFGSALANAGFLQGRSQSAVLLAPALVKAVREGDEGFDRVHLCEGLEQG